MFSLSGLKSSVREHVVQVRLQLALAGGGGRSSTGRPIHCRQCPASQASGEAPAGSDTGLAGVGKGGTSGGRASLDGVPAGSVQPMSRLIASRQAPPRWRRPERRRRCRFAVPERWISDVETRLCVTVPGVGGGDRSQSADFQLNVIVCLRWLPQVFKHRHLVTIW